MPGHLLRIHGQGFADRHRLEGPIEISQVNSFIVKHSKLVLDTRNATKNVQSGREKIRKA